MQLFLQGEMTCYAVSCYSSCPLARGTPQICIFKTSPTSGSSTQYTEILHEVLPFFPHPQYYLSKKIRSRKLERWRTQKNEGESSLNDAPPRNSTINYHGGRQKMNYLWVFFVIVVADVFQTTWAWSNR